MSQKKDDGDKPFQLPHIKDNRHAAPTLLREASKIHAAFRAEAPKSFRCFYHGITIRSVHGPAVFNRVIEQFQKRFFEDIAEPIEQLRAGVMPVRRRYWVERTKKASKDADLAIIVLWLVAFPTRPFFGQIGAVDREQAGILKKRIEDILFYNEWLKDHVEVVLNEVRSKKKSPGTNIALASFDILAADAAGGAHGGTPDLLIINELTHIGKWEFAQTLMTNAAGVPQGIMIIATNAGFKGSKAEAVRNNAIVADNWKMFVLSGPSPWTDKATLVDEQKLLLPAQYKRLWLGQWVSGVGDAVDDSKVDQAFRLDGPTMKPEPGWDYLVGLDLGVSHDHSGLFVMGLHCIQQKLKCAYWQAWNPRESNGEVDLTDVARVCERVCLLYKPIALYYDPHQAVLMAQQLTQKGFPCKEMSFSVLSNQGKMATGYMQVMNLGILSLYDDESGRLRRDLGKFTIVERAYGFRLEATSDEYGHADVGTAMVICLPAAVELLGLGSPDFSGLEPVSDKPLTREEIQEMPDEFKELFNDPTSRRVTKQDYYGDMGGGELDDLE